MIGKLMAFTGLSSYALIALMWGASVVGTSGYVGYKAYGFGANSEKVKCEIRVNALKDQVDKANAAIKEISDGWAKAYERIDQKRESEVREAEQQEAEALAKVQQYEDELRNVPDNACKPLDDADIKRLRD